MSAVLDFICSNETAFKSKARLTSLYSDFSLTKTTNPDGYAANVKSWTSALQRAALEGVLVKAQCSDGLLSLDLGSDLVDELYRDGLGRPAALPTVAAENIAQHAWLPIEEFKNATSSVLQQKSWMSFHLPTPLEIAQWGLRRIGFGALGQKNTLNGQYVLLSNLEIAAQKLRKYLSSEPPNAATTRIHSLDTFKDKFSSILSPASNASANELSQSDMTILLRYLSRDKEMLAVAGLDDLEESITIKLPSAAQAQPEPISQNDVRIAQLKTLVQTLATQVSDLESRVEKHDRAAKSAISSSSSSKASTTPTSHEKSRALTALRQKRLASATLEKRQASLNQIEDILFKIDEASSQVEIVSALENGASVLKELNKQVGGVDRVDDVMERLHEEMTNVEEVGTVIAEGGQNQIDEAEIEDELEALEAEEERRQHEETASKPDEKAHPLAHTLPDVPATEPDVKADLMKRNIAETEETNGDGIEATLNRLSLEEGTNANVTNGESASAPEKSYETSIG